MQVTKCDACAKTIKKGESKLSIGGAEIKGWNVDVCEKCAGPYVALLKKSNLLKTENRA